MPVIVLFTSLLLFPQHTTGLTGTEKYTALVWPTLRLTALQNTMRSTRVTFVIPARALLSEAGGLFGGNKTVD